MNHTFTYIVRVVHNCETNFRVKLFIRNLLRRYTINHILTNHN